MLSEQIKQLHYQGLTPEQIAEQLKLERTVVEYELLREAQISEEDIPEADFKVICRRLVDIAKNHDDDHLAANVGMFLVRQKRGMPGPQKPPDINIVQLNNLIIQSQQKVYEALRAISNSRGDTGTPKQEGPAGSEEGVQGNS